MKSVALSGFHFVEIWQYHISRESEAFIKRFREQGDDTGLSFPIVGMYPKLHFQGDERRREMREIEKLLSYANILGSKIIKIFVGKIGSAQITQAEYDNSVETMKKILSLTKTLDLIVTGETHQKTLFDSISTCQTFMLDVNAQNFKVCFQPFNLEDTKQAINDYRMLADHVVHVHYQGRKNNQMELLTNSTLDYGKLTRELIKNGFSGYISIEFVKDCVVENKTDFNLDVVLHNAQSDRDYIMGIGNELGIEILR